MNNFKLFEGHNIDSVRSSISMLWCYGLLLMSAHLPFHNHYLFVGAFM